MRTCVYHFFFVPLQPQRFLSMSAHSYISQLSPVLFWDVDRDHMDTELHSAGLIQRVLEYGTLQDWRLTRMKITAAIRDEFDRVVPEIETEEKKTEDGKSPILAMSNTNKEDYRCYQFRQSTQTLWNS